jgi:hypothetical protein
VIDSVGQLVAREWLTPPEIARERGIRISKVLAWIAAGELAAVNHATNRLGRPRWRISRAALAAFDQSRLSSVGRVPAVARVRKSQALVVEYF